MHKPMWKACGWIVDNLEPEVINISYTGSHSIILGYTDPFFQYFRILEGLSTYPQPYD